MAILLSSALGVMLVEALLVHTIPVSLSPLHHLVSRDLEIVYDGHRSVIIQSVLLHSASMHSTAVATTSPIMIPPSATVDCSVIASSSQGPTTTQSSPATAFSSSNFEFVSTTPVPVVAPTGSIVSWAAPAQMTDLSEFNISKFAVGWQNMGIVQGIPADASATVISAAEATGYSNTRTWDNSTSVLEIRYPANSINPGNPDQPQGGVEFYAEPLQMASAQVVSLAYSVFFPESFDWVHGGKLPGLYGGHTSCSGGDDAVDCFSTRLMWREHGAGELYLYAPKDKQTKALCGDQQSVCDSVYGLSIGRGSFNWTIGGWTHVNQTVALNTPGEPDGIFALDVNGQRAIQRADVFYRDVPPPPIVKPKTHPRPNTSHDSLGSIIGSLLRRGIFSGPLIWRHRWTIPVPILGSAAKTIVLEDGQSQQTFAAKPPVEIGPASVPEGDNSEAIQVEVPDEPYADIQAISRNKLVGFKGLFFSTFFGGHEQKYATPRDQYTWFKDFSMTYDA